MERPAAITKKGQEKRWRKMSFRTESTGWVGGPRFSRSSFLRRKVARQGFDGFPGLLLAEAQVIEILQVEPKLGASARAEVAYEGLVQRGNLFT